jgi:hypothetical protein
MIYFVFNDLRLFFLSFYWCWRYQINALKTYVVENKLERRSAQWIPIDDSEVSFPQLMEEQLRSITFGVYQLKLSSSYIQEYMDGASRICVHKDDNNLIRVRIQSRPFCVCLLRRLNTKWWQQYGHKRLQRGHLHNMCSTKIVPLFVNTWSITNILLMIHVDFVYEYEWDCYHLCERIF